MKALRAKLYSMKLEEETSKRYNQRKIQVRKMITACKLETSKYKVKVSEVMGSFQNIL